MINEYKPDLSDYAETWILLGGYTEKRDLIKSELEEMLADITVRVSTDPKFFINGKAPSMSFVTSTYHVIGYDLESREKLHGIRAELARLEGIILELKGKLKTIESEVSMFQTLSANARSTLSFES